MKESPSPDLSWPGLIQREARIVFSAVALRIQALMAVDEITPAALPECGRQTSSNTNSMVDPVFLMSSEPLVDREGSVVEAICLCLPLHFHACASIPAPAGRLDGQPGKGRAPTMGHICCCIP